MLRAVRAEGMGFVQLTLQAGLMMTPRPDASSGGAFLLALSVANVFLLVSPFLVGVVIAMQVLPESIRKSLSKAFGIDQEEEGLQSPPSSAGDVVGVDGSENGSSKSVELPDQPHAAPESDAAGLNQTTVEVEMVVWEDMPVDASWTVAKSVHGDTSGSSLDRNPHLSAQSVNPNSTDSGEGKMD
jgi:hypothetical protein